MGETSDTDPESSAFFPPAGSGMNIPDHETNFWALLKNSLIRIRIWNLFFLPWVLDGKIRIRDKHSGSATLGETDF
jgi:hypothetical protein